MRLLACLSRRRIILTLALLLLTVPAWPYDLPEWRATLKGIKVLRVDVISHPVFENIGLTKDQIQVDVELRLRQSGITLAPAEAKETPVLLVNLGASQARTGAIGVNLNIELVQFVRLSRDMSIGAPAITWGTCATGIVDASTPSESVRAHFRNQVRDSVDKFINAYLEQNPKP